MTSSAMMTRGWLMRVTCSSSGMMSLIASIFMSVTSTRALSYSTSIFSCAPQHNASQMAQDVHETESYRLSFFVDHHTPPASLPALMRKGHIMVGDHPTPTSTSPEHSGCQGLYQPWATLLSRSVNESQKMLLLVMHQCQHRALALFRTAREHAGHLAAHRALASMQGIWLTPVRQPCE